MKIAHVTPVYPPYRGGIGAVAFEYTERLRERGHDVEVLTPRYKDSDDPEYVRRIKPDIGYGNAALVSKLYKELEAYDLVHLHYPFFGGAEFVATWKFKSDKPLVTTYHMDVVGSGVKGLVFKSYGEALKAGVLKASDRILVSSYDYASHSSIKNYVSRHPENLVELPFGVDTERFAPGSADSIRSKLGIGVSDPVMIMVGGLDPAHYFKGVPVLLHALKECKVGNLHTIIVGDGSLRPSFEATAKMFDIHKQIHFVGGVGEEDLPDYYRAADFHILPSIDQSEAFGIVTMEAAASGRPSIVSNLPGVRSVIEAGVTGVVVRPNGIGDLRDKIEKMCISRDRLTQMGKAARERAIRKYNWSTIIDTLEGVYKTL